MSDKPRVLFVDDNANLLDAVKRVLRKQIDLVTAIGAAEAIEILEAGDDFAVLISDQNMPDMKGDALLGEAARRWPLTVRVMLTGNDDQSTAIAAVNTGHVFRFLRKPCDPKTLMEVITASAAQYDILTAEKRLLEQTLAGSVKVLSDMLAFLRPDLFQRSAEVRKCVNMIAARVKLPQAWELDLAAMLYPLGLIAVPDELVSKYANGGPLTPEEHHMIDQSTEMASSLVGNIPRLDKVANGIALCRKGFDGSGFPEEGEGGKAIPLTSRILRIAIDLVDAMETGQASAQDIGTYLKNQARLYDPELLQIVIAIVEDPSAFSLPETHEELHLKASQLAGGDTILKDILDKDGRLILAAGAELTEITAHRLLNLARHSTIEGWITVSRGPAQP